MKKRKPVSCIEIDEAASQVKRSQPPACYNKKAAYCLSEVCGAWFDTCVKEEGNNGNIG